MRGVRITFSATSTAGPPCRDELAASIWRAGGARGISVEHIWVECQGDTLHAVVFLITPRPVDALAAGYSIASDVEQDSPGLACTDCALLAL